MNLNFQRVQNKEVYIFRLSEANNAGLDERPKYFKLYDARNDLEMASLFPRDFDQVARRLATDDEYYAKYFRSVLTMVCLLFWRFLPEFGFYKKQTFAIYRKH